MVEYVTLNNILLDKLLLNSISKACKNGDNLVPPIIDAAKNYCTMGEIVEAMKLEFGEWTENSVF